MAETQYNIVIAGSGKLAKAWFAYFQFHKSVAQLQVLCRNPKTAGFPKSAVLKHTLQQIQLNNPIFIIAVADRAISKIAHVIYKRYPQAMVWHCSGTVLLKEMPQPLRTKMVLYPMYSFNGITKTNWTKVPLFVEGLTTLNKKNAILKLFPNMQIYTCKGQERMRIHCSAVIAHNFSNALLVWANAVLPKRYQKLKLWYPLLYQWCMALQDHAPETLQTGPALRKDKITLQHHINLISHQNLKVLYRNLTRLIQMQHEL